MRARVKCLCQRIWGGREEGPRHTSPSSSFPTDRSRPTETVELRRRKEAPGMPAISAQPTNGAVADLSESVAAALVGLQDSSDATGEVRTFSPAIHHNSGGRHASAAVGWICGGE
jgi:hypothetical protein